MFSDYYHFALPKKIIIKIWQILFEKETWL